MPRTTTRHTQLTPDAFRELAEAALEELYDNAGSLELHDLTTWRKQLSATIARVNDHTEGDTATPVWRGDAAEYNGDVEQ